VYSLVVVATHKYEIGFSGEISQLGFKCVATTTSKYTYCTLQTLLSLIIFRIVFLTNFGIWIKHNLLNFQTGIKLKQYSKKQKSSTIVSKLEIINYQFLIKSIIFNNAS
jgi:hypothetical protein